MALLGTMATMCNHVSINDMYVSYKKSWLAKLPCAYTYKTVSLNTSTYSLIPSLPHAQLSLLAVCDENWWCGRLGMRLVSSTLSNSVISLNKILWIRSSGFYMYLSPTLFFSSFSVSSYINGEERLSDTNLRSETFADVSTECSSRRLW